jgi:peroxiredoxin
MHAGTDLMAEASTIEVGLPAPSFVLPAALGGTVSPGDYLGKSCVVLVFLRGFG